MNAYRYKIIHVGEEGDGAELKVTTGDDDYGVIISNPTEASVEYWGNIHITLSRGMALMLAQAIIDIAEDAKEFK